MGWPSPRPTTHQMDVGNKVFSGKKIVACLQVIFLLTNRAIFCKLSQKSQFKMPGRSILIEVSARVIGMFENRATANQAAMQASVHRATVFRIKSKFLQTVSVKNRPKPGRPRSTTAVQDRFLRLTLSRHRARFHGCRVMLSPEQVNYVISAK